MTPKQRALEAVTHLRLFAIRSRHEVSYVGDIEEYCKTIREALQPAHEDDRSCKKCGGKRPENQCAEPCAPIDEDDGEIAELGKRLIQSIDYVDEDSPYKYGTVGFKHIKDVYKGAEKLIRAAQSGRSECLDKLSATIKLEAIGGGKSKYAQGRRDLANIILPLLNTLPEPPKSDGEVNALL